jgi:AraC-like DNA-binding protein
MRQARHFDPRQEMGREDFELQYMRDTYLQDVQLHHHDFHELYFLISGDVTYTIESRQYHVMPGDLLLISPQELHQNCIRPDMVAYERFVLWVDPQLLQRISTPLSDLTWQLSPRNPNRSNLLRLKPEDSQHIRTLLEQLWQESENDQYGADLLRQSLLVQLLVSVNRLAANPSQHDDEVTHASKAVSKVVDYINLHYSEPLSLDMLAELVYVSKYHLSHEFNRQVGTSVYRYIQKKRLQIARQLLGQGKRPNEVYCMCGFSDYAGFYRAFRAEYEVSPREYAKSVRPRSAQFDEMD